MNKYEIIGIVGEGAYGVVYKAKCKETGDFGKYNTNEIHVQMQKNVQLEVKIEIVANLISVI